MSSLKAVSVKIGNPSPPRVGDVSYDNNINVKVAPPATYKVNTTTGIKYLRDLGDVSIPTIQDGFTLVYNGTTKKFEAKDPYDLIISNINGGTY